MQEEYFAVLELDASGGTFTRLFNTLYKTAAEAEAAIEVAKRGEDAEFSHFSVEPVRLSA